MSIWLIGAGVMARDYARVLQSLEIDFEVIGRGPDSATEFEKLTGKPVTKGRVSDILLSKKIPKKAIVAVSVEELAAVTAELIRFGVKRILVEKPAGLNLSEIDRLNQIANEYNASVLLGYNRRFYGSVEQAREFILADGGVLSAQFEFTEWSHVIDPLIKGAGVKEHWILGNSSHVIDLAFHLIGQPVNWEAWHSGAISWHPTAARFSGAGITDQNVLFSYLADWQAPGRWGLELLTAKRRLILRPMEQLQVMHLGTVKAETIDPIDDIDQRFKPGLFRQTNAFLSDDDSLFCSLNQQVNNMYLYYKLAGYE